MISKGAEPAILVISGYTEGTIIHHGVMHETPSFIGKPYSMQALARKVRQVLNSKAGRRV